MESISIVLDPDTIALLDASANMRAHSREATLKEAIEKMRADDLLLESSVAEGRQCISKGDLYTLAQMDAANAELRDEIMRKKWK